MIALLLAAAALPSFDAKALSQLRAGETISQAQLDGTAGTARAWTLARCAPEKVFAVLTDHAKFPEFMPHLESVQILRRSEHGERALQVVNAVVSKARYALDYAWDAAALRVDYALAEDVPHDIRAARGHWQLWPFEGGTLIEYETQADLGRPVPGFVRRYLAGRGAKNAVEAVRDRAANR